MLLTVTFLLHKFFLIFFLNEWEKPKDKLLSSNNEAGVKMQTHRERGMDKKVMVQNYSLLKVQFVKYGKTFILKHSN